MAGVQINTNPESEALEASAQVDRESAFAAKFVESLDLPASLAQKVDVAHKEALDPKKEVDEEGDPEEEVSEQDEEKEIKEKTEEDQESSKEDEDLIPKSKVQKRIDELTQEKKRLEQRIKKIEEQQPKAKQDDEMAQLENMDEDQLRDLKRQVRMAQVKNSQDEAQLSKLLDLEEKIDQVSRTAPQRFIGKQVSRFNEAVSESSSEIEGFEKSAPEIFKRAQAIFNDPEYSDLKSSINGQALAWKMAVREFSNVSKLSAGKSKATELERQVNTLKKKVSMDTSSQKNVQKEDSEARLFNKAKHGGAQEKLNFFKSKINVEGLVEKEHLDRYA